MAIKEHTPSTGARILRIDDVKQKTGHGRSSIYEMVKKREFPAPIRIGARSVGWLEHEVDAWLEQRIAERDSRAA